MASDAATAIAYVGAFAGPVGGGVALFNSWKTVSWKRAELANTYMKDFNSNPELVFAGRCLDWEGGVLALPESLCAYMPGGERVIQHDKRAFNKAISPNLTIKDMVDDPRVQIYQTSIDSFLSWLALVASALDRRLFFVADIEDIGYWVAKIESEHMLQQFILAYGYKESIERLSRIYRKEKSPYRGWHFLPANVLFGRFLETLRLQGDASRRSKPSAPQSRPPRDPE